MRTVLWWCETSHGAGGRKKRVRGWWHHSTLCSPADGSCSAAVVIGKQLSMSAIGAPETDGFVLRTTVRVKKTDQSTDASRSVRKVT